MAVTPNYSWPIPVATDYVKDGWDAIADLGNAIDTTVAALPTGAVTKITANTFTSASAVNLSSVLSDTYKYYRLYLYGYISTSAQDIILRFRENTTDKTTGYYAGGVFGNTAGTVGSFNQKSNANGFGINQWGTGSTDNAFNIVDITRVNATEGFVSVQAWQPSGGIGGFANGKNNSMTNFNGLSIIPNANTITGAYELVGIN